MATISSRIDAVAADLLKSSPAQAQSLRPNDASWVRQSFIVGASGVSKPKVLLDPVDAANRDYSSATFKYTNSTVGGNFCINPPPQFTPYADPPIKGLSKQSVDRGIAYSPGMTGMGQYYSEAIDDNNRIIHLSFGFASYNSLWQFFTGFYNDSAATLARTGRTSTGLVDSFLKLAFTVLNIVILPLTILPILFGLAGDAIRFFLKMPASKFYYFKEGMAVYWSVVNNMVNNLAVNQRLVAHTVPVLYEQFMGEKPRIDRSKKTIFHQIFPEMDDGVIDVRAIASKAKRQDRPYRLAVYEQLLSRGDSGWYGKVRKVYTEDPTSLGMDLTSGAVEKIDAEETKDWASKTFYEKWLAGAELGMGQKQGAIETDIRVDEKTFADPKSPQALEEAQIQKYQPSPSPGFFDYLHANLSDGSRYASFRVSGVSPVTESFQNTSAPSALADKLNAASQSAREVRVSYAEGNVDSAGVAASVLQGAQSLLSNTADLVHLGGMVSFAGRAFVDIPEHWTSHNASVFNDASYKIDLVSPYNNVVSQMLYIYIPLCMLLAGTMPLATGKQSYTSPFLCQLFDRGRIISRLAMISSLTISRGTSHLAWDRDGQAMGLEVNLTVKDLSSVVTLPIHEGMSIMPLAGLFDTENKYHDMLMAYSGLSLQEVTDPIPIFKRQADQKWEDIKQYFTRSRLAMDLAATLPGQVAAAFMSGTDKK
jgi:hypothetical protein